MATARKTRAIDSGKPSPNQATRNEVHFIPGAPIVRMAFTAALDTTIAVVTPENIEFKYQLAGPFRRLPAYLIDLIARWSFLLVLWIGGALLLGLLDLSFLGPFAVAGGLVFYFLVGWFYGAVFETFFNGRTIGKWACGIRTIDIDGRPISGKRAVIRNLLRVADLAPIAAMSQWDPDIPPIFIIPTGMAGLLSMVFTRRLQRLGDLAAGTMVIIDERTWRVPTTRVDDPRIPALASYIPAGYRVSRSMARTLAVYAERRHHLTPARRREVTRHLTVPLIDLFEFRSDIDPDLLMQSLYYKTFLAESQLEQPDLGPLAGYSPLKRDSKTPPPPPETNKTPKPAPVQQASTIETVAVGADPTGTTS